MMRRWLGVGLVLLLGTGCTSNMLRDTATYLNEREVKGCIAGRVHSSQGYIVFAGATGGYDPAKCQQGQREMP